MNKEDLLARVRRIFPHESISEDYVDGKFDSITLRFSASYNDVDFGELVELSKSLGTDDINIRYEDGTDWGDDKDDGEILVVIRGWSHE